VVVKRRNHQWTAEGQGEAVPEEKPSRSAKKRRCLALQDVGERLVRLPPAQVRELGLPETLERAVIDCRDITSREARRRQLQYVGRLLRELEESDGAGVVAGLMASAEG
jgi:ribosome-associated protein